MRTRVPNVTVPGHRVVTRPAPAKMDSTSDWWEACCECGYVSNRHTAPGAALKSGRDHQYGILQKEQDDDFRLKAVNAHLPAEHQLTLEPVGALYRSVCCCGRYRSVSGHHDAVTRLGAQHAARYVAPTPRETST